MFYELRRFIQLMAFTVGFTAVAFVFGSANDLSFSRMPMSDDVSVAAMRAELEAPEPAEVVVETVEDNRPGKNFVLWLDVPGMSPTWIREARTPWFDELNDHAFSSKKLMPPFPSTRAAGILTQVTGKLPDEHGIWLDAFAGEDSKYPLLAETIWQTSERQKVATLVHGWPQTETAQPAGYDSMGDEARISAFFEAWIAKSKDKEEKVRLAMLSLNGLKSQLSQDDDEAAEEAMTALDKQLGDFFKQLEENWRDLRSVKNDKLWVFLTSPHGVAPVEKLIKFDQLLEKQLSEKLDFTSEGPVTAIWYDEGVNDNFKETLATYLKTVTFWRPYYNGEYPPHFGFTEGGNNGPDLLLVAKRGYAFTNEEGSEAVFSPAETGGPFYTTGYSTDDVPTVRGAGYFFRLDEETGGSDLSEIRQVQLHSTVCRLLGIEAADGAEKEALDLE